MKWNLLDNSKQTVIDNAVYINIIQLLVEVLAPKN